MKASRVTFVLGLAAALALAARGARADNDQPTIISAHGDALARATSTEALVEPKPTLPPNSAPPVVPSQTAVVPAPAAATPAPIASAPRTEETPERGRAALIVAGTLLALGMFLWERRRKD